MCSSSGETAWIGLTETSTCAQVSVAGIYRRTQRNYCLADAGTVRTLQGALDAMRQNSSLTASDAALTFDRVRFYFQDRRSLLRARRITEEQYKFWASTPYDKFESKLRLVTAARVSAWAVLIITLGSVCGTILCTFLAWVSRRRYEIALLKAQGARNSWVAGIYLLQSGTAGLVSGLVGIAAGAGLYPALGSALSRSVNIGTIEAVQLPIQVALGLVAVSMGGGVARGFGPGTPCGTTGPVGDLT